VVLPLDPPAPPGAFDLCERFAGPAFRTSLERCRAVISMNNYSKLEWFTIKFLE